jgi:hypothetical protein
MIAVQNADLSYKSAIGECKFQIQNTGKGDYSASWLARVLQVSGGLHGLRRLNRRNPREYYFAIVAVLM